jgi:hypothetical protein
MSWLTFILGVALVGAPWLLGYDSNPNAMWSSVILGVVVALASAYKAIVHDKANWEYWVAALAGLLAILAPFALGFSAETTAVWSTILIGALTMVVAAYELLYRGPEQRAR